MKRYFLILLFFVCCHNSGFSQSPVQAVEILDFSFEVEEQRMDDSVSYNLLVDVKNNSGKINYYLFKERPLIDSLIHHSEPTHLSQYKFKELPDGQYAVVVKESEYKAGVQYIYLSKHKNSKQ